MMLIQIDKAKEITGGLARTSKMPCPSYSLPATACQTGSKLAKVPGSVCHGCYALKGFYYMPNVKQALAKRLEAIKHPQWVDSMVIQIGKNAFFRWHDSGDLQSLDHLKKIIQVCRRTPNTMHWLPTKEPKLLMRYVKQCGTLPDNLVVRISAAMVDSDHTTSVQGCLSSTVVSDPKKATCRAFEQGNQCKECRDCWDKNIANVSYLKH